MALRFRFVWPESPSLLLRAGAAPGSFPVLLLAAACIFALPNLAGAASDRLAVLGGDAIEGAVTSIAADGRIEIAGSDTPLNLADIRRLERPVNVAQQDAAVTLHLSGGGTLLGRKVTIRDEVCTLDWSHGQPLSLPIDMVRAVRLVGGKSAPGAAQAFENAIASAGVEQDQLFLLADDQVQTISGVLNELNDDQVSFVWQNSEQQVARAKVYGLVLAAIGSPPDRTGQCQVTLADGSSFWGKVLKLEAGKLYLEPAAEVVLVAPWDAVALITVKNQRLAFLSDLEPVEAAEQTLVAFRSPYRRDRSVGGNPLTLGGARFDKGLGVHSRSLLTFANDGFDLLAATIGIDGETQGLGDCEFVVLADGEELLRQRMRGADPPRDIQLRIAGHNRVTLLVEPGEDLDLADHADWCDARFVKGLASSESK